MASLKQTQYVREAYRRRRATRRSTTSTSARSTASRTSTRWCRTTRRVAFVKSKVARIAQNDDSGNPVLHGVDTEGYHRYATEHDLVVLAVGMEPESLGDRACRPTWCATPRVSSKARPMADCSAPARPRSPLDVNRSVQSATGAALHAIKVVRRRRRGGGIGWQTTSSPRTSAPAAASARRSTSTQLQKIAQKEGKMQLVRRHELLCSAEGVQTIRDDIASEGVTHVMIGGLLATRQDRGLPLPRGRDVACEPARGRALGRGRRRGARRGAPGNGRRLRAHGLRRAQEDEGARRQSGAARATSASWWSAAASPG